MLQFVFQDGSKVDWWINQKTPKNVYREHYRVIEKHVLYTFLQDSESLEDAPILPKEPIPIEIYADGDELEFLKKQFIGIPFANNIRSNTWKGIFAQFIYDNLT